MPNEKAERLAREILSKFHPYWNDSVEATIDHYGPDTGVYKLAQLLTPLVEKAEEDGKSVTYWRRWCLKAEQERDALREVVEGSIKRMEAIEEDLDDAGEHSLVARLMTATGELQTALDKLKEDTDAR